MDNDRVEIIMDRIERFDLIAEAFAKAWGLDAAQLLAVVCGTASHIIDYTAKDPAGREQCYQSVVKAFEAMRTKGDKHAS